MPPAEVLVIGGTGTLGRRVTAALVRRGRPVRVLTRRADSDPAGVGAPDGARRVIGDLVSGAGLDAAVDDVEAIVHCATGSRARSLRGVRAVDVEGTRRLLESAARAGVGHLVYPSIVGIDGVSFFYYRAKVAAEEAIAEASVPFTIARSTQFHSLPLAVLRALGRGPVQLVPRAFRLQPVDEGEVAERLAAAVEEGPAGRIEDFGGPEALTFEELAERYRAAAGGKRSRLLRVPVPGGLARAARSGRLLCPRCPSGAVTFDEYVRDALAP